MPKNIYIIGAQCTGKTTLFNALVAHFSNATFPTLPTAIPEQARILQHAESLPRTSIRDGASACQDFQRSLVLAQHAAEAAVPHGSWAICDRSGVDPVVYARRLISADAAAAVMNMPEWRELERAVKNGVVVVCEPGVEEWLVDDGVRVMPDGDEDWRRMHSLFCDLLEEMGVLYAVLGPCVRDINDRVDFVVREWEKANGRRVHPEIITVEPN